ncbi:Inhibitor of growth proteins N-terminal histone-binding family protein [Cryptosporidium meleagridis]|uniref:Inhibitor of growth proteins N-terminal histone-binding family protein n=1 Tax=Cryptosporidium meleagridis TaxID=93969 RepID=A0A2P4Z586_9CRYT|nr:Inhibitor of growth proteins N-terminal histone-binding family protein [Cryptosporidium meleagridis]
MSDPHEIFMEDISLLPGWILRNLSLMREIDKKSNDLQIILEEKRDKYLKELSKVAHLDSQNIDKNVSILKIDEINELQKELKALLKEKIAISDQSVHYIRYDGEILKKHYEQLRESLTENFMNNSDSGSSNSYSGRSSFQGQINFKNPGSNNFSGNESNTGRNSISETCNSNDNWNNESQNRDKNVELHNKPSFAHESTSRASKRRRSSATTQIKDTFDHITKKPNSFVDTSSGQKTDQTNLSDDNQNQLCSICEGIELANNKFVKCEHCSNNMHVTCSWSSNPILCRKCCKKSSVQPSITYDIEYSASLINTPKSENNKISKGSRKK